MSFGSFLGGKRICLGKTFAEIMSKVVAPSFINFFDFEFVNKEFYRKKILINISVQQRPKLQMRIKLAS